jgi:hypothetical protein
MSTEEAERAPYPGRAWRQARRSPIGCSRKPPRRIQAGGCSRSR